MSIYRGAGGASDATDDSTVNAVAQYAASASTSASSAATSASNAASSASGAAVSASQAASSASAAALSASNASSSGTNAANSASLAATKAAEAAYSAILADNSADAASVSAADANSYMNSAETYMERAEAAASSVGDASGYADAAAASAASAAISASSASNSAANASSSEGLASTYASIATTKATEAQTSATSAASSASAALASQNAASNSAASAASSSSTASSSASGASINATIAQNARNAAQLAEANAEAAEANAATSAAAAAASESAAATSAANAATSATAAAASATTATDQATAANLFATSAFQNSQAAESSKNAAQTSAANASTYATSALTSKNDAASSATSAAASAAAAAASFDSFDDRYLGAKASAPTVDNDGNALLTGALYFNTADQQMRVWDGNSWEVIGSAALANQAAQDAASAASSASSAQSSATAAAASATSAQQIVDSAAGWATAAANSATSASNSAAAAQTARAGAEAALDSFQDAYLGSFGSDPGSGYQIGSLYFNTTEGKFKVWTSANTWVSLGGVGTFNTRTGDVTLQRSDVEAVTTDQSNSVVLGAGASAGSDAVAVGQNASAAASSVVLGNNLTSSYQDQLVVRVRQNPSPAPTGALSLQYDPSGNEIYAVTGGGVTQIVAGTNITISSTGPSGTGVVTINSTGGGGGGGGPTWVTAKAFSSEPPQVAVPSGFDATTMTTQYVYAFSNMPSSSTPTGFSSFGGNAYFGSIYISYSMDWSSIVDPVVLSSFSPNSGTGGVVAINPADDSNSFTDQPWSPSSYYSISSSMPYDSLFITGTNKKGRAYTVLYGDFSSGITMPIGGTLISAEYSSTNNQTIVLTEYDDAAVSNIGAGMIPYFTLPFSPMGGALAFWYTYS